MKPDSSVIGRIRHTDIRGYSRYFERFDGQNHSQARNLLWESLL